MTVVDINTVAPPPVSLTVIRAAARHFNRIEEAIYIGYGLECFCPLVVENVRDYIQSFDCGYKAQAAYFRRAALDLIESALVQAAVDQSTQTWALKGRIENAHKECNRIAVDRACLSGEQDLLDVDNPRYWVLAEQITDLEIAYQAAHFELEKLEQARKILAEVKAVGMG